MMSTKWLLVGILAFCLLAQPAGGNREHTEQQAMPAPEWVEKTLQRLTLREKIGQMIVVPHFAGYLSADNETYEQLVDRIRRGHIGGILVETRGTPAGIVRNPVYELAHFTNRLQREARVPLLVAADFENGAGHIVEGATEFPDSMAVAATGEPDYARLIGRVTATEARALGVHWVLAPVADVNSNPENPIINIRSYGQDPDQVARFVRAFVEGCQASGALATAKHFPGHGDTGVDTHLGLATLEADRERLESIELAPFRAAIAAGVKTIMTGHILVPELDPESPASLSSAALTGLLRQELGFRGLIASDAMSMGAITRTYSSGQAAVQAVQAGVDVLLVPPEPEVALAALKRAVEQGELTEARIDESVRRILEAKASVGLHQNRYVDFDKIEGIVGQTAHNRKAQQIADEGISLVRDADGFIPVNARDGRGLVLVISADPDPHPGATLEREFRRRGYNVEVVRTDTRFRPPPTVHLPELEGYDWALVVLFVRIAPRKDSLALPDEHIALANRLLGASKPVAMVAVGSPYMARAFPQARTFVSTSSTTTVAERAAVRALVGEIIIVGKLPVTVPGVD